MMHDASGILVGFLHVEHLIDHGAKLDGTRQELVVVNHLARGDGDGAIVEDAAEHRLVHQYSFALAEAQLCGLSLKDAFLHNQSPVGDIIFGILHHQRCVDITDDHDHCRDERGYPPFQMVVQADADGYCPEDEQREDAAHEGKPVQVSFVDDSLV